MITETEKNRKQAEYQPAEWTGRRLSECRVETVNKATGARLEWVVSWGRVFGCESDQSGAYHDMPAGNCSCQDSERAMKAGRHCRHSAALERVLRLLEDEKMADGFRAANPQKFANRVKSLQGFLTCAQELAAYGAQQKETR